MEWVTTGMGAFSRRVLAETTGTYNDLCCLAAGRMSGSISDISKWGPEGILGWKNTGTPTASLVCGEGEGS